MDAAPAALAARATQPVDDEMLDEAQVSEIVAAWISHFREDNALSDAAVAMLDSVAAQSSAGPIAVRRSYVERALALAGPMILPEDDWPSRIRATRVAVDYVRTTCPQLLGSGGTNMHLALQCVDALLLLCGAGGDGWVGGDGGGDSGGDSGGGDSVDVP